MTITSSQRPGVVLLIAALVVAVIGFVLDAGYPNIAGFFLLPLLSGVGFLAAATLGGRAAGLWPTALTTTFWGVLILAHFHGIIPPVDSSPGNPVSIAIYLVSIVVAGVLAYVVIHRFGLRGSLRAVAVVVLASIAIYGAALAGVPGIVGWWLYPILMIAMAVPLLRVRQGAAPSVVEADQVSEHLARRSTAGGEA